VTDPGDDNVEPARSAEHEIARKIKPQYAEGELVKVAWASNQAEGELIQGLLLEEGIPSVLRRSRGFDVPDFLAAGPRDIVVPVSGVERAREVLEVVDTSATALAEDRPRASGIVIAAVVVGGMALTALVAWLALQSGA
jgi:hypothetical protein